MFQRLAAALLLRRVSRALDRISDSLDRQAVLLARLTDHLAPLPPADTPDARQTVRADSGVTHLDVDESAAALAYIERTRAQTGHTPDDDEVLIYLADEKT